MNNRLIIYTLLSAICQHEVFGMETPVQQAQEKSAVNSISAAAPEYANSLSVAEQKALEGEILQGFDKEAGKIDINIFNKSNAAISVICRVLASLADQIKTLKIHAADPAQDPLADVKNRTCDLRELYALLPNLHKLEWFSANNCAICDAESKDLGEALRNCKRLKILSLSKNCMSSIGGINIFEALTGHPSLLNLSIVGREKTFGVSEPDFWQRYNEHFDDSVVPALCDMLLHTRVRRVMLGHWNCHNIHNMASIAAAIELNHSLLEVYPSSSAFDTLTKKAEIDNMIEQSLQRNSKELYAQLEAYIRLSVNGKQLPVIVVNKDGCYSEETFALISQAAEAVNSLWMPVAPIYKEILGKIQVERRSLAKKMIADKLPINAVIKYSGLSVDEVEELVRVQGVAPQAQK